MVAGMNSSKSTSARSPLASTANYVSNRLVDISKHSPSSPLARRLSNLQLQRINRANLVQSLRQNPDPSGCCGDGSRNAKQEECHFDNDLYWEELLCEAREIELMNAAMVQNEAELEEYLEFENRQSMGVGVGIEENEYEMEE